MQTCVQHEQDGRRQQGPDSEMQVERNILSFSRVSEQCQLHWESLRVSRRLSGQGDTTVVHLNEEPVSATVVSS